RKRMSGNLLASSTWRPFIACSIWGGSPSGSPSARTVSEPASTTTSTAERERSSKSASTSPSTERATTSCSCPAKLTSPVLPTCRRTLLALESIMNVRGAAAADPSDNSERAQEMRASMGRPLWVVAGSISKPRARINSIPRLFCAVACGVIVHTLGDKAKNVRPTVVHVEGDPDAPTNRGTLCPKGATLKYDIDNPNRILSPKVRRPGADRWEDISWDDAIQQIAR